jgi:hypothetical protein
MAFKIPNEAQASNVNMAELDSVDFDILVAGYNSTGVISGCAVTAQSTPDMTVAVASGVVVVAGTRATVGSGSVTLTTADGSHPRFDLITVNNAGTKAVTAGTAAAEPVFPAIPANSIVLVSIYVPASDTSIESAQITDKRVINAISVTQLDDGTDGELITWNSSGVPTTVAVGTVNYALVSGGTGVAPTFQVVPVAGGGTGVATSTGTGSVVLNTSPTLVTPALGTPASGVMTNVTGTASNLTAGAVTTNANLTGHITSSGNAAVLGSFTSAQLATALSDESGTGLAVFNTSPTLVTPALGTPASGVMTNASGTAASLTAGNVTTNANLTGHVTSVGNAAVLGSFTSLQLLTALTNETGTGSAVFATSPTLVTPALGTPASGVMTSVTGTASGLTAGNVTTNANLTGDVTSSGNAATLALSNLTGAVINVAADSIPFLDADGSTTRIESIADLATAMAGTNLTASSGQLVAGAAGAGLGLVIALS